MGQLLSYRVLRLYNDRPNVHWRPREWHKVINWGNSITLHVDNDGDFWNPISRIVNPFEAVRKASNKLVTFQTLENTDGIRIPTFTTDRQVANGWLSDGIGVVCRTVLSGHSGAGIVLVTDKGAELPNAPLYVQYVKKQDEYRVHVSFGEVIDVQQKRRTTRGEDGDGEGVPPNYQIRNHQTGWVYCRENITEPRGLREMAIATVARLGLDFGAVDLIYNAKRDEVYVLECNTAPGLEGTTVEKYAQSFVRALT